MTPVMISSLQVLSVTDGKRNVCDTRNTLRPKKEKKDISPDEA